MKFINHQMKPLASSPLSLLLLIASSVGALAASGSKPIDIGDVSIGATGQVSFSDNSSFPYVHHTRGHVNSRVFGDLQLAAEYDYSATVSDISAVTVGGTIKSFGETLAIVAPTSFTLPGNRSTSTFNFKSSPMIVPRPKEAGGVATVLGATFDLRQQVSISMTGSVTLTKLTGRAPKVKFAITPQASSILTAATNSAQLPFGLGSLTFAAIGSTPFSPAFRLFSLSDPRTFTLTPGATTETAPTIVRTNLGSIAGPRGRLTARLTPAVGSGTTSVLKAYSVGTTALNIP